MGRKVSLTFGILSDLLKETFSAQPSTHTAAPPVTVETRYSCSFKQVIRTVIKNNSKKRIFFFFFKESKCPGNSVGQKDDVSQWLM